MATGNFSNNGAGTPAVSATGTNGADGIVSSSDTGTGVHGQSQTGRGVEGISGVDVGLYGQSQGSAGVYGQSSSSNGMAGHSDNGTGVSGEGHTGVYGRCTGGDNISMGDPYAGVYGTSTDPNNPGVHGHAISNGWGVAGTCDGNGWGVYGRSITGEAGHFDGTVGVIGDITVTGDIVLTNADVAEEFDIAEAEEVELGTVMVLDQEGALQPSQYAYDKTVVGVISGAGDFKPGIVLDKQQLSNSRMSVALVGKVYCKVDAQYAPIKVGDLLTTSPSLGCAMKATDPYKAFGSVIGKALSSLDRGCGLIPILVTLQ